MINDGTTGGTKAMSPLRATWLVAKREVTSQLRSKSFIISTAVLLIAVLAMSLWAGFSAGSSMEPTVVAVTEQTEGVIAGNPMIDPLVANSEAEAQELVSTGNASAALLPSEDPAADPLGFYLLAEESVPEVLMSSVTVSPRVELLNPGEEFDFVNYLVSLVFGMVFMMSAISFGSAIAQNTVVEKQTRTVELLVSAVSPRAILGGKILGNSALAITQTALILLIGLAGLGFTGQMALLSMLSPVAIWFTVFFIFGFVLIAAVFATSASLVSRIEDTGSVLTPVIFLTMIPYFAVLIFGTNPAVMAWLSFIPFTSTVAMPVRLFTESLPWWQPIAALALLIATTLLVIALAARVYQATLLKTGPRVKLTEAWKGDRV